MKIRTYFSFFAILFVLLSVEAAKKRTISTFELLGSSTDGVATLNLFAIPLSRSGFQYADCIGREDNVLFINPRQGRGMDPRDVEEYFVQIVTGDRVGEWAFVKKYDPDAGEIVLARELEISEKRETRIRIGRCYTLFSVFGEYNTLGLKPGASIEEADEVILFDPETQLIRRFYISTEVFGWTEVGRDNELISDVAFKPSHGLLCRRKELENIPLLVAGVVDLEPVGVPVYPGVNLLCNSWVDDSFSMRLADVSIENYGRSKDSSEVEVYRRIVTKSGDLKLRPAASALWLGRIGLSRKDNINVVSESAIVVIENGKTLTRAKLSRD
ncbi:hypothetical protein MLD52_05060 [Puniceicoccaceae bacterium K14]|nr:hypothetical protein [Puniceicoccaceae bacterium K14]